ncbi:MAG: ComEC/Rec2 family competence protein [Muribaculaceae bacterium]|nr:ComEC/Rec2 family competence protein [Muribaculaceae bacterium]
MANKEGFLKLSEAPFLKYLLSFVIGILLQMVFNGGYYIALSFVILSFFFFYGFYKAHLPKTKFAKRNYFGYAIFSLFIALGAIDAQIVSKPDISIPKIKDYAIAIINEDVNVKEHSVESKASIIKLSGIEDINDNLNVVLYIQPDSLSKNLIKGDVIIFEQNLQPINFSNNLSSFNYNSKLEREGFYYSQYIPCNGWNKIDYISPNSIKEKSLEIKNKLLKIIKSFEINDTSKALISAMILGDKAMLSKDMRNAYSTSGLSHILAVSGLHIGIIAFALYLLLFPLKLIKLSFVRPLITILILWAYIFVIGFPPSAVRAAVMATFVLVGEVVNRKGTTVNSLFAAALFILAYNPNYISDVSFQLSFIAVFSIFYIYPFIYSCLPHKNKVSAYISSTIAVTLAAQIGTLPLSVYYFNQLPLMGLFTNLLVIPILPIVIVSAILTMIISVDIFFNITDSLFSYIDFIANLSNTIPYSYIDDIYIKSYYILFLYIVIFGGIWILKSKRSELLIILLILIAAFIITETVVNKNREQCKAVIYDDNRITALNFVDKNYNYVLTIDTVGVEEKIEYMGKKFWIKEALPNAIFITDSVVDNNLFVKLPYIAYKGEKYLILNSSEFKNKKKASGERLFINRAIVCNGFSGSVAKLTEMFIFEEIVIASNLNYFKRKSIIKECKALKIPYFDIKEHGTYLIKE